MEVVRIFEFDSAHRLMRYAGNCCNIHGHRYRVEIYFNYFELDKDGFSMDFSDIKKIAKSWIDDFLDHALILNPADDNIIELCRNQLWKVYKMGLGTNQDKNPTAENMASELFYVMSELFSFKKNKLSVSKIVLYETPNQFVEVSNFLYGGTKEFENKLKEWEKNLSNKKQVCI